MICWQRLINRYIRLRQWLGAICLSERGINTMADFADDAAEVTEMNLQVALQNARGLACPHPFTGICRNCDHPVADGAFCQAVRCRFANQGRRRMTRWEVKGPRLYATQGSIQVSADVPIRGQYTDARAWLRLFRLRSFT